MFRDLFILNPKELQDLFLKIPQDFSRWLPKDFLISLLQDLFLKNLKDHVLTYQAKDRGYHS